MVAAGLPRHAFNHWRNKAASTSNSSATNNVARLHFASGLCNLAAASGKSRSKRRSGCPVSISLEILGDRWSLLIIRNLMVCGLQASREFQESGESFSTNIFADRVQKLEARGTITEDDGSAQGELPADGEGN